MINILQSESGPESGSTSYGFAFVDCAALRFWVGSINDDASCAALGALLMQVILLYDPSALYGLTLIWKRSGLFLQVTPKEIIYESKGLPLIYILYDLLLFLHVHAWPLVYESLITFRGVYAWSRDIFTAFLDVEVL